MKPARPVKLLNRLLDDFSTALFLAMLILVSLQIFFRFVLRIGVPWTEELSRLVFLYLAFFGSAIALREGTFISVDTFPLLLKGRARAALDLAITIFSLVFLVVMLWGSLFMTRLAWPTVLSTVGWISNGWLYVSMDVSFALMILYTIGAIVRAVQRLAGKDDREAAHG